MTGDRGWQEVANRSFRTAGWALGVEHELVGQGCGQPNLHHTSLLAKDVMNL